MVVRFDQEGNLNSSEMGLPCLPRPETKLYLIPSGTILIHDGASGDCARRSWRCGTSLTATATMTASHPSSTVSAAFSPISRRFLLFSPSLPRFLFRRRAVLPAGWPGEQEQPEDASRSPQPSSSIMARARGAAEI